MADNLVEQNTPSAVKRGSPAKILVVDDEAAITDLLQVCLAEKGYAVSTAANGKEALEALRAEEFDLIITDLRMPRLDGLQLLKAAKDINPRLPVIFISGYGEAKTVVAALKAGAENFLAKPLDLALLEQVVEQTLALACLQPRRCPLPTISQETRLEAPSRPECVQDLVYQLALSAVAVGFASPDLDSNLKLALVEAVTNAMEHGNNWDEKKLVQISAVLSRGEMKVTIKDQGPGFNHRKLMNPTTSEHLLTERGRGVFLVSAIMDEVVYNQAGNQVTLIKRKPQKGGCS
jgi:CheY-like chemotaxis protein